MNDLQIVKEFKNDLLRVRPESEVYFYGSRVSHTNRDDSDYDVLVLLDKISPGIRDEVYDIAWEVGFKYDALISPVLAEKKEFLDLSASPFFTNVRQHGVIV